jgi:plastocyanin
MIDLSKVLRLQIAVASSGVLMLAVIANMATAAPATPNAAVTIGNFTFKTQVLTVKPGTTVTWTNADDIPHTVTSNGGLFKSKVLDTGDKFSFTFAKPGQFGYFCSLHPHMTGTIVVKA